MTVILAPFFAFMFLANMFSPPPPTHNQVVWAHAVLAHRAVRGSSLPTFEQALGPSLGILAPGTSNALAVPSDLHGFITEAAQ